MKIASFDGVCYLLCLCTSLSNLSVKEENITSRIFRCLSNKPQTSS